MKRFSQLSCTICAAVFVSGCSSPTQRPLEVLDSSAAFGAKLAVTDDFHLASPEAESRLAVLLRKSFRERGLTVVEDAGDADLILLPTLGRVKKSASSDWPERKLIGETSGTSLTASRLRRGLAAADGATGAQHEVGLLLTAVPARDYQHTGSRPLRPVWRIYVSRTVDNVSWDSAVVPLVRAASSSAAPLAAPRGPAR
jgi:hypothetical protein